MGVALCTAFACGVVALSAAGKTTSGRVAAQRDAERILRRMVMPAGATRVAAEPAGDGGVLHAPASKPAAIGLVDRHRFWEVPSSLDSVIAFIKAHPPRESQLVTENGALSGPGIPPNQWLTFSLPATASMATRWLNVDAVALPGGQTGLRADAQVLTVQSHERVPRRVGVLRIAWTQPRHSTLTVTNRPKISAVARAVDHYPLGADVSCSEGFIPPSITFSFLRSRNGPVLASVRGVTKGAPGAACEPTTLRVRGRGTQLLAEDSELLRLVNHILGTKLN